jgi:hypothetical protein
MTEQCRSWSQLKDRKMIVRSFSRTILPIQESLVGVEVDGEDSESENDREGGTGFSLSMYQTSLGPVSAADGRRVLIC